MKLKVNGVEELLITDPNRHVGHRKRLDKVLLQKIKGQEFTAKDLKQMFGYAPNTALCDTQLCHLVEPVEKIKDWKYPHHASYVEERATKWRVL